jgi:hypothetical protein
MISQTEYQATGAGDSQEALILAHLEKHLGEWVPMPELYSVSGSMAVHSRIAGLRKLGCQIEHKNERSTGSRTIKSFYRLTVPLSDSQPATLNQQPS